MSSIKYRPEIDGLRAIAVIPVILFHMGAEWMPGGFIGVDVFFVISGFLITSIIIKEYNKGIFSFTNFWLRRARRILPVMLMMVGITSLAGCFILYGPEKNNLGQQGIAALFSFSNVNFWFNAGNYWGTQAENSPLLHTWSLSVEEQFYLFFPLLLIALLRFNKKHLISSVFFLTIGSLLLFIYGSLNHPNATFYLLPTRAWELGSGSILALLSHKYTLESQNNSLLSLIGLLTILLSYIFITGENGISIFLVFPIIGAVLIIAFSKNQNNISNKFLSVPLMVYIGKLSYSLYIWHWPVLVLSKSYFPNHGIQFIPAYTTPLILLLSTASYHLIEKTTHRNPKIIPYILLFFTINVAYTSFLYYSDFNEDISFYSTTTWNGQLYNVSPNQEWPKSVKKRMDGITVSPRKLPVEKYYAKGGIIKKYGKETPEIVLLGDSHALMWSGVLNEIVQELNITTSFYAADGTQTFFQIPIIKNNSSNFFTSKEKYTFDQKRLTYLRKWKPKVVIIAARWADINDAQVTQNLIEEIENIGSNILLIEQPPELFFGDKNAPKYLSHMGMKPTLNTKRYITTTKSNDTAYKKGRKIIRQISDQNEHCEFIAIYDIFTNPDRNNKNKAWVLDGHDVLYVDDDHLSHNGSLKAKNRISRKIQHYFAM